MSGGNDQQGPRGRTEPLTDDESSCRESDEWFLQLLEISEEALLRGTEPPTLARELEEADQDRVGEAIQALRALHRGRRRFVTDDLRGLTFGRFELIRPLGSGGYGLVLLANDPVLNRRVALKIARPDREKEWQILRESLIREARAAARLDHPGIVPIHSVEQVGSTLALVSAYVEGLTLTAWLERKPGGVVRTKEAALLVRNLAVAVQHAHDRGVLHRDLKPGNILMADCGDGSRPMARITDFGLARVMDEPRANTRTMPVGTRGYAAPEQLAGLSREIGPATDVYGLGAILSELLTGAPPGQPDRRGAESIDEADRRLFHSLSWIAAVCLQFRPSDRYPTAAALVADLDLVLAGRDPRGISRRRVLMVAAALIGGPALGLSLLTARQAEEGGLAGSTHPPGIPDDELAQRQRYFEILHQYRIDLGNNRRPSFESIEKAIGVGFDPRSFEWWAMRAFEHGERRTWQHELGKEVYYARFSPEGEFVVSAGQDGTARVWPREGEGPLVVLRHELEVNVADFSPCGKLVATGDDAGHIRLWDWRRGEVVAGPWAEHEPWIVGLGFVGTDRLVSLARDGRLLLWELPSGRILRRWQYPAAPAGANRSSFPDNLGVSIEAGRLAVAGTEGVFLLDLELNLQQAIPDSAPRDSSAQGCVFSRDGRYFAFAFPMNLIQVWERRADDKYHPLRTGRELQVGRSTIYCMAFRPDNSLLAGHDDRDGRISFTWKITDPGSYEFWDLSGHTRRIWHIHVSPDGKWGVTASRDGTVKLWGLDKIAPERILALADPAPGPSCAFLGKLQEVRSLDRWGRLRLYSPEVEGEVTSAARGGIVPLELGEEVLWAQVSPDGGRVLALVGVAGQPARALMLAEAPDQKSAIRIATQGAVVAAGLDPTGQHAVFLDADGLQVLDLATRTRRLLGGGPTPGKPVRGLALAPNGETVVLLAEGCPALVFTGAGGSPVPLKTRDGVYGSAEFSRDGRYLACTGPRGIDLFDVHSLGLLARLESGGVATAFSPDALRLAVAGNNFELLLHDPALLAVGVGLQESLWTHGMMERPPGQIETIQFRADGRAILMRGGTNLVVIETRRPEVP